MNTGRVVLLSLLLVLVTQPAGVHAMDGANHKGVVHTVFLWLQQPGDQRHRQQLLQATQRLRAIPGVLDIRFGEVITSERDIVDDSFDVGIYFYFRDIAAMNRYLTHPIHKAVVEQDIKPIVSRIRVYDFHDANLP